MPPPHNLTKYGLTWKGGMSDVEVEIEMVRHGGRWKGKSGTYGEGLLYHYMRLEQLLWPKEKLWHRWNELQLKNWLEHRTMGVIGPSSSGKSNGAATDHLADYYCFPECTTTLICSTTKERLQDRIFGEMKKYHRLAKERYPWLPGNTIEGRMRIVSDHKGSAEEGRDFRNGIIGVPCLQGGSYRGIAEFIGIKNKRMRIVLDELQMLPPAVLLALSNLDKNEDFKATGLGNPKDTTDALGVFCEPSFSLGGWEGGVDQRPITKTWPTRRPDGVCVQLVGTDSPNLNGELGIPLITQEAIDRDIEQYGRESLQFSMMNQGMMPRGQGSRRVITRQLCAKNRAHDDAIWTSAPQIKLASLDAAYKGVGGDRCVLNFFTLGQETREEPADAKLVSNLVSQMSVKSGGKQVLQITDTLLVPIDITLDMEAEEQIVLFVVEQCVTRNVPPENFFYDSGMRTTLVSAFCRLWSTSTNPIDCGGKPSDRAVNNTITIKEVNGAERPKRCDEHYSKFVTELWFSVRYLIESGQIRGLKESTMMEGCAREWKIVGNNRIEIESKKEMKEKVGKSPDLFDCLTIGVEGARRRGLVVDAASIRPPRQKEASSRWKQELMNRAKESWRDGALNHTV